MVNIIVVLPKLEEAKTIKSILVRSGYRVNAICTTGAQAIQQADGLQDGVVICAYKMPDMLFQELKDCLPVGFELLLLASQKVITEDFGKNMICLSLPLRLNDFVNTVGMITQGIERKRRKKKELPQERSSQENALIAEAKGLLMVRNHMTEEEAHKYLQKSSMDSGTSMTETAQMVLSMMQN